MSRRFVLLDDRQRKLVRAAVLESEHTDSMYHDALSAAAPVRELTMSPAERTAQQRAAMERVAKTYEAALCRVVDGDSSFFRFSATVREHHRSARASFPPHRTALPSAL